MAAECPEPRLGPHQFGGPDPRRPTAPTPGAHPRCEGGSACPRRRPPSGLPAHQRRSHDRYTRPGPIARALRRPAAGGRRRQPPLHLHARHRQDQPPHGPGASRTAGPAPRRCRGGCLRGLAGNTPDAWPQSVRDQQPRPAGPGVPPQHPVLGTSALPGPGPQRGEPTGLLALDRMQRHPSLDRRHRPWRGPGPDSRRSPGGNTPPGPAHVAGHRLEGPGIKSGKAGTAYPYLVVPAHRTLSHGSSGRFHAARALLRGEWEPGGQTRGVPPRWTRRRHLAQAAAILPSGQVPHRPIRSAGLRPEHTPRLPGGEHHLGPGRGYRKTANPPRYPALAGFWGILGLHPGPGLRPKAPRTDNRAGAAGHLHAAGQGTGRNGAAHLRHARLRHVPATRCDPGRPCP